MNWSPGPNLARTLRLLLAALGGYAFAAGYIALLGAGLPHLGIARGEAVSLGMMTGLVVFAWIVVWAVATAKPVRTAVMIAGVSAGMIVGAPLLAGGG